MVDIADDNADEPSNGAPGTVTAQIAEATNSGDWLDSMAGTGNIAMRPGLRGAFIIHSQATFGQRLWRMLKMPFTYLIWGVIEI